MRLSLYYLCQRLQYRSTRVWAIRHCKIAIWFGVIVVSGSLESTEICVSGLEFMIYSISAHKVIKNPFLGLIHFRQIFNLGTYHSLPYATHMWNSGVMNFQWIPFEERFSDMQLLKPNLHFTFSTDEASTIIGPELLWLYSSTHESSKRKYSWICIQICSQLYGQCD